MGSFMGLIADLGRQIKRAPEGLWIQAHWEADVLRIVMGVEIDGKSWSAGRELRRQDPVAGVLDDLGERVHAWLRNYLAEHPSQ